MYGERAGDDKLGNITLLRDPRTQSPSLSPTSHASSREYPDSWRREPEAAATPSVTDAAESEGNERARCPRGAGRSGARSRQGAAAPRGPGQDGRTDGRTDRQDGGSAPWPQPGGGTEPRGSVASPPPPCRFVAAFAHPAPGFPHAGAIPSGNSWDIEADCETACASPCQGFPIVAARRVPSPSSTHQILLGYWKSCSANVPVSSGHLSHKGIFPGKAHNTITLIPDFFAT